MTVNIEHLRRQHALFISAHERIVQTNLEAAGMAAQEHVKRRSKFKRRSGPGKSLKDKTEFKVITRARGKRLIIKSNKKTATFLEFGTKGHGPVTAKALRFVIGGRVIYSKWVRGIRPTRFLWKATRSGFRVAGRGLEGDMERIAKRFGKM